MGCRKDEFLNRFSTLSDLNENPFFLKDMADRLYSYKCSDEAPPNEWIDIVANMKNEKDRTAFSVECCLNDAAFTAKIQTIMVFRKHLPNRILESNIIPVIAYPEACESVLILPSKYWSTEFKEFWSNGFPEEM